MGSSFVLSFTFQGIEPTCVRVETDIARGLPAFTLVGLPDTAISEARARVRAAIKNSGFTFPSTRITVNLSPANVKKFGTLYDVPIAISILVASGQLDAATTNNLLFMGALGLDGSIQGIQGALLGACLAKSKKYRGVITPTANIKEATCVQPVCVYSAKHLTELVTNLKEGKLQKELPTPVVEPPYTEDPFAHIIGQTHAKRALTIAAAGRHHTILNGPPGSGKTTLAKAFANLLPPLTQAESLELTKIYSVAGLLSPGDIIQKRPFRDPHHTSSSVALVGGGSNPRPGEITLAHSGVLFLDELPEFSRHTLETLRQPLQEQTITIARSKLSVTYPANVLLLGAMNPCPCGYATDTQRPCVCLPAQQKRYVHKLSGPFLDRIGLFVTVPRLTIEELTPQQPSASPHRRTLLTNARALQEARAPRPHTSTHDVHKDALTLLTQAVRTLHLSTRTYFNTISIARTIADLEQSEEIKKPHISEALQYQPRFS